MNRPKVLKLFTVLSIFLCILAVQNVAYASSDDTAYYYTFPEATLKEHEVAQRILTQ